VSSWAPSLLYFPNQITPDELGELARQADVAGFEVLWSTEEDYDSFVYDQHVAGSSERLRAGSSIARYYKRHPLLVAESAAAIDRITPGRFVIGLGTGPAKRADPSIKLQRWGSDAAKPVARLSEYIDVVRLALSGEEVNFEGEFYAVEKVRLQPDPNAEIPIYLAGGGPQLTKLAARKADGAFLYFLNEEQTRQRLATLEEEATAVGRDAPDVAVLFPVCVDEDREAARNALRRHLFFPYLALPYYQQLLADNGFPEAVEQIKAALADGGIDAAWQHVPDEALDGVALAGEPGECTARLEEFMGRGIDSPVLYPFPVDDDWVGTYRRVVELFAVPARRRRS
jgi:alkanesulfonate monooxygenase SsuD/methylene tetrahydromethanopterin reductase-like flavin-dependent oxidoreductase (luciferase family)